MRETDDGLYVEGQLDLEDSELAREAWRSLKRNRIGLSFGFLTTDAGRRDDGVKELRAVDLFEITLTGAPANSDTRVLSAKSMTVEAKLYEDPATGRLMNVAELHAHAKAMGTRNKSMPPVRIVSFEA
jgi:phage head maturation protease